MTIQDLQAYKLETTRTLADIHSEGYILRHKKSGARIMLISNEDENKVFHISFRTPPSDSTGVAHILEHCSLCGSEKFPCKDPFVELVKGSLNTFLNAMTFSDKTMYPVASCNDRDFANLMHVYMDAVFHPNIYKNELIFRQEGWSYQLESAEDDLTFNGVVYNEMKGAFSSPEDVLEREILNSLYPDTPYGFESGGDPVCIPDLTYEDFLDFHRKYYHPSNAYLYLYGNMDMAERLDWLDREYLSHYDFQQVDSQIPLQPPFGTFREICTKYSISMAESEEDNTYLSWNVSVGESGDVLLAAACSVLEYALLSAPGAPLRQALLDAGIAKDIQSSYDSGIRQPVFSVIAKNSNPSEKDRFVNIIREVLEKICRDGLDEKSLLAGIHSAEFRFREADYGNYPKGLMYGIDVMDSWLYSDEAPFSYIEMLPVYAELKRRVGTGYFEDLIRLYLLENRHGTIVVVEPEKGLTAKMDAETAKKLAAYKDSLSGEQIRDLVEQTRKLRLFQEMPSSKEDLERIPMLERKDIGRNVKGFDNQKLVWDGTDVIWHETDTNGIAYLEILFDLKYVPKEDLPYVGILKQALGMMDTERYTYLELSNEVNMQTGGIATTLHAFADCHEKNSVRTMFSFSSRALYEKTDFVFDVIKEVLFTSKLGDEKRLREILAEQRSRLQMRLNSAGHSAAAIRAMAYFSDSAAFQDLTGGIACYKLVEKLEKNFEDQKDALIKKLENLMGLIFRRENLYVSVTAQKDGLVGMEREVCSLKNGLASLEESLLSLPEKSDGGESLLSYGRLNEGFQTSAKIQYVARTGNFLDKGFAYSGALRILKVILSYDYLWINIRVKGGAYGCMSGFGRNGDSYFTSYRDPNLRKTDQVYEGVPEYVGQFTVDERDMTKYVIGAISELDTPLTARTQGLRSLNGYFCHVSEEDLKRERQEILQATQEDIRALAPLMSAVLESGNLCVLGNEGNLEKEKDMFMELKPL